MELSREADYAVRAMIDLASFPWATSVCTKDIARRQVIPEAMLVKIIARLAKVGLLRTRRGLGGGVVLPRRAETISLLDVVEAIEGPINLNRCVRSPSECPLNSFCGVHEVWRQATEQLNGFLKSIAIADLVRRPTADRRPALVRQKDLDTEEG